MRWDSFKAQKTRRTMHESTCILIPGQQQLPCELQRQTQATPKEQADPDLALLHETELVLGLVGGTEGNPQSLEISAPVLGGWL